MNLVDWFAFVFGDRGAILRCARDRRSLWIGLAFVFVAAVAREHDREYLLAEPWHLLIPVAASLVTASVMFLVLRFAVRGGGAFGTGYRQFLSLFWLTGPLAWLYAIPFERGMSAEQAVQLNLWTLGFVATWRVVLIVRASSVLFRVSAVRVVAPILLLSDVLVLFALQMLPFPLIAFMGGIDLTPSERILQGVSVSTLVIGVLSLPVWLLGTGVAWFVSRRRPGAAPLPLRNRRFRVGPWSFAALALAALALPTVRGQLEQQQRYRVEAAVAAKDWERALELLRDENALYPPGWVPPPTDLRGAHAREALFTVLRGVTAEQVPRFVVDAYVKRVRRWLLVTPPKQVMQGENKRAANDVLWLLLTYQQLGEAASPLVALIRKNRNWLPGHWDQELVAEVLRRY